MKIIHRSTIKNNDGVIDIDILIVDDKKFRKYIYNLGSEFAARKFHSLYRKRLYGRALNVLNKFKIKKEE
jgi:hypothetical protein